MVLMSTLCTDIDNSRSCLLGKVTHFSCTSAHVCLLVHERSPFLALQLEAIDGLTIYGPRPERGRTALCSFNVEGVHPTDISTLLDMNGTDLVLCSGHLTLQLQQHRVLRSLKLRSRCLQGAVTCNSGSYSERRASFSVAGIAVRSGHLCAQPLHKELGVSASIRASLYFYNTEAEIHTFISELKSAINFFK